MILAVDASSVTAAAALCSGDGSSKSIVCWGGLPSLRVQTGVSKSFPGSISFNSIKNMRSVM